MSAGIPIPVTVVSDSSRVTVWVGGILANLLRALVLMTLAPIVLPWHPSYWQALAAVVAAGALVGSDSGWVWWTRSKVATR